MNNWTEDVTQNGEVNRRAPEKIRTLGSDDSCTLSGNAAP